jgi:3-oxoacyl-(acyl-carrier-protein) synthase
MNDVVIHAASWLGPEGFGNDQTGLRAWPPPLRENLSRGELGGLHWSLLSDSDPSRFLRMDLMCRLGFMAAELLGVNFDAMPGARRDRLGVCVESFTGSLDTDIRFAQTPRPSIFAYTLPSTVVGEICIRFRLKGPVLSLISPDTNGAGAIAEAVEWLRNDDAEMTLCLSIEAMNVSTADSIPLPKNLLPRSWHGAALLLGRAENSPREKPFAAGALVDVCRKLRCR